MSEDMLKILINPSYGGFSMSKKAEKMYTELKKIIDPDFDIDNDEYPRHDPILIHVFEELGAEQFGTCDFSRAKIKTIDKKYINHYRIECYDGAETIEIDYAAYELENLKDNYEALSHAIKTALELINIPILQLSSDSVARELYKERLDLVKLFLTEALSIVEKTN